MIIALTESAALFILISDRRRRRHWRRPTLTAIGRKAVQRDDLFQLYFSKINADQLCEDYCTATACIQCSPLDGYVSMELSQLYVRRTRNHDLNDVIMCLGEPVITKISRNYAFSIACNYDFKDIIATYTPLHLYNTNTSRSLMNAEVAIHVQGSQQASPTNLFCAVLGAHEVHPRRGY